MKLMSQAVALALLGAGLTALPALQTTAAGSPAPAAGGSLVQQMRGQASGNVGVSPERSTGEVGFIRARGADGDLFPGVTGDSASAAVAKANAYLDEYAAAFGAPPEQITQTGVQSYRYGWIVRFEQTYRGLPVFGAELKANLDKQGHLTAVSGFAAPDLALDPTPRFSAAQAARRAVDTVRATPPTTADGSAADLTGIAAEAPELVVYRLGLTRGAAGKAIVAWSVKVSNGSNIGEQVFLDANTLKPVNRYSLVQDALYRELYEASLGRGGQIRTELVWKDGDAYPGTLNTEQANLMASAGNTYWFFNNTWGRDSFDGQGASMITINSDPTPGGCPNAQWTGETTVFCNGVTSDDVVAHEWAHAYTQYTSELIYQWQPGAMNEGYSDVWGETIDLINGREDGGEGDLRAPRPDGQCSIHTRGDVQVVINSPEAVAGPCVDAAPAAFGPTISEAVDADVVVARDPDEGRGDRPTDACSPLTNAAEVAGKWVYVDEANCGFQTPVDHVAEAGGAGIILGNKFPDEGAFSFPADADIYGVMVTKTDGARFRQAGTATATISPTDDSPRADSYRWLQSEKSEALGGAIRDMWNPTCYGDPGKVSDAEYKCSEDDGGGVHSNSGVVNHAYSLLVDGGDYNGETVTGLGLAKAAHIFWQAQSAHLTSTSDFVDLADALATSCTELTGQPLRALSTRRETPGDLNVTIDPTDCAQVDAVSRAVELRLDPTDQCDFKPLLRKDAPSACGRGTRTTKVFGESFADGLRGWRRSREVVFDRARGYRWRATDNAPAHRGGTAFAPDPVTGSCLGDRDDISSRNSLISPRIRLPRAAMAPKLSFDHYVATEPGWDGGNLKIRVNGGRWKLLPQKSYTYNAPNARMETAEAGNTNPLAGERGWTGTDGGEVSGSWGRTQVALGRAGVGRGDVLEIRFDFGRDGCNGVEGWYIDNVKVLACKKRDGRVSGRARED